MVLCTPASVDLGLWMFNSDLFVVVVDFIYLLKREEGKEKEKGRNINVWLPLTCSLLGTWPATQACALTRN